MDRALYAAVSGGTLESLRLDIVSNNLANVNTVGFKGSRLVSRQQEFADTLVAKMSNDTQAARKHHLMIPGVESVRTETDFSGGAVNFTGNPLHVALRTENAFFVVEGQGGEPAYTRAGNFLRNAEGDLILPDGSRALGQGGPISLPEGPAQITSNGSVMVNGQSVGQLQVVSFEDLNALKREEGVRFSVQEGAEPQPSNVEVVPQSVEMPNINAVSAMVEMIRASQGFEAYTKTIKTIDELTEKSLTAQRSQ